jgi:hypothetical protein
MKTRKIYLDINIFDDPKFCESDNDEKIEQCDFLLSDGYEFCAIFVNPSIGHYYKDTRSRKMKKCPECKEKYQKAKELNHGTDE